MKLSFYEADSRAVGQEILRLSWNSKVYYRINFMLHFNETD
jgi:hypothetical protein